MQTIGHAIVRLVWILAGLVLSATAAGIFLGFGFWSRFGAETRLADTGADGLIAFMLGLTWSPFLAAAAFLPALAIIAVAELARWRGFVTNIALGGAVALVAFWLHRGNSAAGAPAEGTVLVLLATGFVSGAVYWLVAGRQAGKWLDRPIRAR